MRINYCLPIIKNNKAEIIEIIEKNISEFQFFEVWLDYVDELDEIFMEKLINLLGERLIVLFRRQKLEAINMDLEKRFDIIALISNSKAFLDLDISQVLELRHIERNKIDLNLILSCHNYQETPSVKELEEIINNMKQYNPSIFKIACLCNNEDDAIKLLQLQRLLKQQDKKHIVLGMGKFGTVTRVFGTLFGNEMVFAPIDVFESSAEGQLTKHELERVFEILNT